MDSTRAVSTASERLCTMQTHVLKGQGAAYRMRHPACLQQQACRGSMLAWHLSNRSCQQVVLQTMQDRAAGCTDQVQHLGAESGSALDQNTATMQHFPACSNMYTMHDCIVRGAHVDAASTLCLLSSSLSSLHEKREVPFGWNKNPRLQQIILSELLQAMAIELSRRCSALRALHHVALLE